LSEEAYRHKIKVIRTALNRAKPDSTDPLGILAELGGLDIAAMAGAYIGAAYKRVPAVIDGFISMVAALCACRLNPTVREYLFASHASFEQGYRHAAEALGFKPPLALDMRLGEGSGCPLMFALMDAALAVQREMGTFAQGNIGEEYVEAVRDADFHIRGV
jgi:nicotinate-nucleotide--dimethylbenzimidazole phosphoribosyltransferase